MIYSVMRGILFAELPFADADRIVAIQVADVRNPGGGETMSMPDVIDIRDQSRTLTAIGLWFTTGLYLSAGDSPRQIGATFGSPALLQTLGVPPVRGRWFTTDECKVGANLVPVVIGARIWHEQFASDPNVVGRTLALNGRVRTIVGVMPDGFRFPEVSDVFIPLAMNDPEDTRGNHYLKMAARLAPAATLAAATAELKQIAAGVAREHVDTNRSAVFRPTPLHEYLQGGVGSMLLVLALAVTFVLLIACANVANLLLARGNSRMRELGVRQAMGATRGRVVRQLLTESVLLSGIGGLFGVLLGTWGMHATIASIPVELPYWMRFGLDPAVVAAVATVSVLSGIAFGLAPAWQVTSGDLLAPLREGTAGGGDTRARHRMRDLLVVGEVALAVVLLIGSGLMMRSFLHMQDQRRLLRGEHVLTATITLPGLLYPEADARATFFREFQHSLASLPGVRAAGGVLNLHLGTGSFTTSVQRDGIDPPKSPDTPVVSFNVITPHYLDAVGLPLLRGRDFTDADGRPGANAALVNQAAARKLWPHEDPLGKRIRLAPEFEWSTVVGVVGDVRQTVNGPEQNIPEMLIPNEQWHGQALTWALRTDGDPAALAGALRAALRAQDPRLPLYDMRTLRAQIARSMWDTRLSAQLMGVFSVLALLIAVLGIYGVMAYTVTQRTREIGIRMALGAARADVQRLVVGQALRLTMIGAGLGLAAAWALTRLMEGLLFGIRPDDPPTFVGVTLLLALSSAAAAWLPTARAVRVDPVVALRHE
jgi:putative ABC transport system permease protein